MTRLLLADAHRSFVEALAMLLDAEPGLQVVAAVTQPDDALRVVLSQSVDVAVLTVDGGPGNCLNLAPELFAVRPHVKLVALAESDDVAVLARAIRQGFRAWVPKSVEVSALVHVLDAVLRGETCIPPLLLTRLLTLLLGEQQEQRAAETVIATLTPRERQVLQAMVSGSTRQEIAEDLEISINTLRTHMQSVLGKLGVHTTLAAVTLARRAGFK
jgi:DNA-binding NarL/FixJ family response regulator